MVNERGFGPVLIFVGISILFGVGLAGFFYLNKTGVFGSLPKSSPTPYSSVIQVEVGKYFPPPIPEQRINPSPSVTKKWTLKKLDTNREIFADEIFLAAGWGDWIFFVKEASSSGTNELVGYNFKSDSTTSIMKATDGNGIVSVKVIGNTLFFSQGAYMTRGGVYYLNLPPVGKPITLLSTQMYPSVTKLRNKDWIIAGFGDSCAGSADYYLLNAENKSLGPKTTFGISCGDGEGYLGIDSMDQFLSYTRKHADDNDMTGNVLDVKVASIYQPSNKKTIFETKTLNDTIRSINYLEDQNKILLFGKNAYIFSINDEKVEKIVALPPGKDGMPAEYGFSYEQNGKYCLDIYSESDFLELDLDRGIAEKSANCSIAKYNDYYRNLVMKESEKLVAEMKIPSGFTLRYE